MKGLIVAIQFLTRLPTPRLSVSGEEFARSMRWFPAVGLIAGGLMAMAAFFAAPLLGTLAAALIALLLWVGITGALHLDGLGDIADAAGAAHKDRERMLAAMSDPHVGSFAVVAIGLQLLTKFVLIHGLIERGGYLALLLIPFAARIGPLLWTRALPSLHEGLGARFRGAVRTVDLVIWGVLLLAASWWVPALLAAPPLMLLWGRWLRRRIGGISGDGHGAGIEVVESGLLFVALAWAMQL